MSKYVKLEDVLALKRMSVRDNLSIYSIDAYNVEMMRPADVRENVHGEWINADGSPVKMVNGIPSEACWCNKCKAWLVGSDEYAATGNFCPNCGADMRGKK